MPHRLDCGLLHHAFRGRRGRSVGRRRHHALPFTQWVSGLLYSKAAAASAACWLSCRKLMAAGLLVMAGLLARKGLVRLMRPHQERGWKREDGTSSPTHYRRPGAGTVRGRSILGRLSQLPSMWSWKEELSASFSHNHANLPLLSTASTTVQSGHYQQVAATAAILVEIKSSLEWVQGIWDWLFSADRLVICVRRLTRPFPFFLVANCEPGCGLIIKVRPWKVADTLVKKSKLAGCPWQINEHVLLLL